MRLSELLMGFSRIMCVIISIICVGGVIKTFDGVICTVIYGVIMTFVIMGY